MKKNIILIFFLVLTLSIGISYVDIRSYDNDEARFERGLKEITNIDKAQTTAINVTLEKDGFILKSYAHNVRKPDIDNEKAFMMMDILHEMDNLTQGPESYGNGNTDYKYLISAGFETGKSRYNIQLLVNENNYDMKIIGIEINGNQMASPGKYFRGNERSTELLKELLNVSN